MIISAKIIRKSRKPRYCATCRQIIQGETLRLYGMADAGDPPYVVYLHSICGIREGVKKDPKILKALESSYEIQSTGPDPWPGPSTDEP